MSKTLVLAEKPSVARDLARVLHCSKQGPGCLEGEKYIVTWALGHLVTLADPEGYGDKYKAWRLEDLPMLPNELKLVIIKQTGKQFQQVKAQLQRKDVQEVVIATDAGREGELVARWILEKVHVHKPLKRLWISSVTDKAIQEGFKKLRPGKEYENLYAAAVARAESDWLVGINATRALTCKYNAQLSCGRVQTPTLAIIAQREVEIQNFKPQIYYGLVAQAAGFQLTWQDRRSHSSRTFDQTRCQTLLPQLKGQNSQILSVAKAHKKRYSPELYDLTELQRDAHKRYGFSAKETLSIMQKLYESHKLLTYPRTDSRYLSGDLVDTLKERLKACDVGSHSRAAAKILSRPITAHSSFINDSKVSDHHAIIPTEQVAAMISLTDKERKIYQLVVTRFMSVLLPPYEYEQTTLQAKIGSEEFTAKGKRVLSLGWRELYADFSGDGEEDQTEQNLPLLQEGQTLPILDLKLTEGKTKPPAPFNEATLLSAMENPAKYLSSSDEGLKKILGETGGLGTVATRADIIEKLFHSFLIEEKGKSLFVTAKGKQLLELVPEDLRSPVLTAQWEQKLSAIAKGTLPKNKFLQEIREYAETAIRDIKNSQEVFKHDNMTRTRCPECGKYLLEVKGKKGKMLVCQDRECGYRKGVSLVTNARCPNCHKKLELRGQGEGQIFVCPCGYREKLSSFKDRKDKDSDKGNKRDVQQYLNKQSKEKQAPINTALADALAKLKLKE